MEQRIAERGLAGRIQVASSGTTAYHVGEPMDRRMSAELSLHGIAGRNRARQFTAQDLEEFDLLLAMSRSHFRDMEREGTGGYSGFINRIRMFRDFDPAGPGEVPDPYYGGREGFTRVYEMVDRTVDCLLDQLEARGFQP